VNREAGPRVEIVEHSKDRFATGNQSQLLAQLAKRAGFGAFAALQLAPRQRELPRMAGQAGGPEKQRNRCFAIAILEDHDSHRCRYKRPQRGNALKAPEPGLNRVAQLGQLVGRPLG